MKRFRRPDGTYVDPQHTLAVLENPTTDEDARGDQRPSDLPRIVTYDPHHNVPLVLECPHCGSRWDFLEPEEPTIRGVAQFTAHPRCPRCEPAPKAALAH